MSGAPDLVLFDDRWARAWQPFALTRPAGELLFGAMKLVERAERVFGSRCIGHLTSSHLSQFSEPGTPPVLDLDELPRDRDLLFWSARAVAERVPTSATGRGTRAYVLGGRTVGYLAPAGRLPTPEFLDDLEPGPTDDEVEVEGSLLEWVWDLVLQMPDRLARDLGATGRRQKPGLPKGAYHEGKYPLVVGHGTRIEPGVLFDTREGPIRIGADVEVRAGTRLMGPAAVGDRSRLLGGSFERISVGPFSYLRGEIDDSVVLGYTNKAHDGYLGHAYLGKWVNLGAFTTNSDLKNNYRPVRVWTPGGVRDSGHLKVGCFLGDHVKTGIGTLLGTGTVVGAGSNIYGSVTPPRYVPPFSWGTGDDLGLYRLPQFLDAAGTAMARRGLEIGESGRRYLESCWREGRGV